MTNHDGLDVLDRTTTGAQGAACTSLDLELSGLSCGGCARSVERLLAGVPGVTRAEVRFVDSLASEGKVWLDTQHTSAGEIVGAIEHAGYGVAIVSREL
jgi:copper chaperone CopZ